MYIYIYTNMDEDIDLEMDIDMGFCERLTYSWILAAGGGLWQSLGGCLASLLSSLLL